MLRRYLPWQIRRYFLLRKLQKDPAIDELSRKYEDKEIFEELESILKGEPKSFADAVRPYALLVALSFKEKGLYLKQAAEISSPQYKWFQYLARVLVQNFEPTSVETFRLNAAAEGAPLRTSADVTVNQIHLSGRTIDGS